MRRVACGSLGKELVCSSCVCVRLFSDSRSRLNVAATVDTRARRKNRTPDPGAVGIQRKGTRKQSSRGEGCTVSTRRSKDEGKRGKSSAKDCTKLPPMGHTGRGGSRPAALTRLVTKRGVEASEARRSNSKRALIPRQAPARTEVLHVDLRALPGGASFSFMPHNRQQHSSPCTAMAPLAAHLRGHF